MSPRRAPSARERCRAFHARDDDRDERAARTQAARAPPSSRTPASSICCTCGARTVPTSTGSAPRIPSRSCRSSAAYGVGGRLGPEGELEPLDLASLPDGRRRSRRRLPALRLPRPLARAGGRGGAPAPPCRARTSSLARVAPEFREYERASTTALARTSRRPSRATCGRLPSAARRRASRRRSSCARRAASPTSTDAAAHPARALVSGPAAASSARRMSRGGRVRERDRVRHGRHVDRRLPHRRRPRRARRERDVGGLPRPPADGRPAHRRRRRRLDRLARRGRRAAGGAGERGRATRPGVLRARRHAADGDRREPAARHAAGASSRPGVALEPRGSRGARSTASTPPRRPRS